MGDFFTVEWQDGAVVMLDQRLLPTKEIYRTYRDYRAVAKGIRDMVVRGAPAIGVAAEWGLPWAPGNLRKSTMQANLRGCAKFLPLLAPPR